MPLAYSRKGQREPGLAVVDAICALERESGQRELVLGCGPAKTDTPKNVRYDVCCEKRGAGVQELPARTSYTKSQH